MEDLIRLEGCHPREGSIATSVFQGGRSPLCWKEWDAGLRTHPDQRFRQYIVKGIRSGFRIGFDYRNTCWSKKRNMKSAVENPQVVHNYLEEECKAGRVVGPLCPGEYPFVHTSSFGVIPKSTPGKWRLIVDLWSPEGGSVNDGIRESWCSLTYATVDDAIRGIVSNGKGALLIKVDIRSAYRVVQIYPDDRWFIGMLWDGSLFVDAALPFGLRSAPKIFMALADAAEWIVRQRGINFVIHYLDDFLKVTSPDGYQGEHALRILLESFERLGLPVAWDKLEGPSTCLTFLGFQLDSSRWEVRLPRSKLEATRQEVSRWVERRTGTRRELESIVGKLAHASRVVRPGMRHLFELLSGISKAHHHVCLGVAARSDLLWWYTFMAQWNGIGMITHPCGATVDIWSDASGSYGCRALCPTLSRWFQLEWARTKVVSGVGEDHSITWMELLPIVLSSVILGAALRGQRVTVHCDNAGAVAVVNSGYSRVHGIMHLLRCLFFIRAYYEFSVQAVHVKGVNNVWADAISRNNASLLHSQAFQESYQKDPLPEDLLALVIKEQPDWTSLCWTQLFRNCLQLH